MSKKAMLTALLLVIGCSAGLLLAQADSSQAAARLFEEALKLQQAPRSGDDLTTAAQKYTKAIQIYEKERRLKQAVVAANNLGFLYERLSRYADAADMHRKAIGIAREIGDSINEAKAFHGLAWVYVRQGLFKKAVELDERALKLSKKTKDRHLEGRILNDLGVIYKNLGDFDRATTLYQQSLEIKRETKDVVGEGHSLFNLAQVYRIRGQYDMAIEMYRLALEAEEKTGDLAAQGTTMGDIGWMCSTRGLYAEAVSFLEKALKISRTMGDPATEGRVLNDLGFTYYGWGKYEKAVELYQKSLDIKTKIGDLVGEGHTLNNLGLLYHSWGQYTKAVKAYERSTETSRKTGDRASEAKTLLNLGLIHAARGNYPDAFSAFQIGLATYQELGLPTDWPKNLLGCLYLDTGALDKAGPLIQASGRWASLGRLELARQRHQQAKTYYEKLVEHSEKNRDADLLFAAYTGLGLSYEGLGNDTKAAEYFSKAVNFTEELRSGLGRGERETFFDVRVEGFYRTSPYEGLVRVLLRMNNPLEALKYSEYTKARVFAESLSKWTGGKTGTVPAEVLSADAKITDQLAALKKLRQQAYEKQTKDLITSLDRQIKELEGRLQDHIRMVRKRYPLFAGTRYPQPLALADTALAPNEWVLSYDVTDSGTVIFLTRGKTLVHSAFKPIGRTDLDGLVSKLREPLQIRPEEDIYGKLRSFDFTSAKRLFDLLVRDALSRVSEGVPLIVIPDDSLGAIPFEMLALDEGGRIATDGELPVATGTRFFGDRNPISYYQSMTALTLARTFGKQKSVRERMLVIDDPVFAGDDPRLKQTERSKKEAPSSSLPDKLMSIQTEIGLIFPRLPLTGELGKSLKTLNPKLTEEYSGLKAAKPLLFEKPLDGYGSMVFATHGYFGKDLPGIQEPVLVLTLVDQPEDNDGFLRLSEVMGLKINTDVVALTACQTGLGRRISGEGTMGMGRAFQYAGARSVLMSLWSVSEDASVKLVESLFKQRKEGKSKLDSLKMAREEIRKEGYDHPFFWAPFILVGEVD